MEVKKSLVVIDNQLDQTFVGKLEINGYFVIPYTSGRKAIKEISEGLEYDLALVDYELNKGDFDGLEVIRILSQLNPEKPIAFMSAWGKYELPGTSFGWDKLSGSSSNLVETLDTFFGYNR
jgi:CheY-like chemotaxis protein